MLADTSFRALQTSSIGKDWSDMMQAAQELQRVQTAKNVLISGVQCVMGPAHVRARPTSAHISGRERRVMGSHGLRAHSIDWWLLTAKHLADEALQGRTRMSVDNQETDGMPRIHKLFLKSPSGA
jgi:hypothetical protein